MKSLASLFVALALVSCVQADPEITGLNVVQNDSRLVTITYTLTADAIVTLDMTTNGVSIGSANFQSVRDPSEAQGQYPVNKLVRAGTHTMLWQPKREWPGHVFKNDEFKVELRAWPLSSPPDYMVVDLTTPSNRWFYVTAADIPGGLKTADPDDAEAVKALEQDEYRTTKLVMRRIPAAGNQWLMGAPYGESQYWEPFVGAGGKSEETFNETQHYVTLTEDCYMAIYELTAAQSKMLKKETTSAVSAEAFSYDEFRGAANTEPYKWPTNGHAVDPNSFAAKLRAFTGLAFDLPTESVWEYACRAGTSTMLYDGSSTGLEIGWTIDQGSGKDYNHTVGLLKPNAWGLYDMIGNVYEWTLDQVGYYSVTPVSDPVGPATLFNPDRRIARGGSWCSYVVRHGRSGARMDAPPADISSGWGGWFGVRLCCPIAIPAE